MTNTIAPIVSDIDLSVGAILTVTPGVWSKVPDEYTYAWYRDTAPIYGAVSATYTLTEDDIGFMIACHVIAKMNPVQILDAGASYIIS